MSAAVVLFGRINPIKASMALRVMFVDIPPSLLGSAGPEAATRGADAARLHRP